MHFKYETDEEFLLKYGNNEVLVAETIKSNGTDIEGGLLDQDIFGCEVSYTCRCGNLHNILTQGEKCPRCGVTSRPKESRFKRFGYFKLYVDLPNPIYESALFRKILNLQSKEINDIFLGTDVYFTENAKGKIFWKGVTGNITLESGDTYLGKGILFLKEFMGGLDIDHIKNPYFNNRKNLLNFLVNNPTTSICRVVPAHYRDIAKIGDSITVDSLNILYKEILSCSLQIKSYMAESEDYKENFQFWYEVNRLYRGLATLYVGKDPLTLAGIPIKTYKDVVAGKFGTIRSSLLGKRSSFSARTVNASVDASKIDLSQDEFLVPFCVAKNLLRLHIASIMLNEFGIDYKHAMKEIDENSPITIQIMHRLDAKYFVYTSRAPALHRYSFVSFRMRINFDDINDKTLKISSFLNAQFNLDYDGDSIHSSERVMLLDGTTPTMKEIVDKYGIGNYVWVYSFDYASGKVVPSQAKVLGSDGHKPYYIKVTLDNGEVFKVNTVHKMMLRNGTWKEAQYLTTDDVLMPLNLAYNDHGGADSNYQRVWHNNSGIDVDKCLNDPSNKFTKIEVSNGFRKLQNLYNSVYDLYIDFISNKSQINPISNSAYDLFNGDCIPSIELCRIYNVSDVSELISTMLDISGSWEDAHFMTNHNDCGEYNLSLESLRNISSQRSWWLKELLDNESINTYWEKHLKSLCSIDTFVYFITHEMGINELEFEELRERINHDGEVDKFEHWLSHLMTVEDWKDTMEKYPYESYYKKVIYPFSCGLELGFYASCDKFIAYMIKINAFKSDSGDNKQHFNNTVLSGRHIVSVEKIKCDEPTPFYDLEVSKYHNFALACGVFTHNTMMLTLPLTFQAQMECEKYTVPSTIPFYDKNGGCVYSLSLEFIYGLYYMTNPNIGTMVNCIEDAKYLCDYILTEDGKVTQGFHILKRLFTKYGFGDYLPQGTIANKKFVNGTIGKLFREQSDRPLVLKFLNELMTLSIASFNESGISIKFGDFIDFDKSNLLKAEKTIDYTIEESKIIENFKKTLPDTNSFIAMVISGAKGDWTQIKQMMISKGVLIDNYGNYLPPIKESLYEGLSVDGFMRTISPSRRGMACKVVMTAKTGDFYYRLVKSLRDIVVVKDDCGTKEFLQLPLSDAHGRYLAEDVDSIYRKGLLLNDINHRDLETIYGKSYIVSVRSPATCKCVGGVCAKCYGLDIARNKPIEIDSRVGITAGSSVSEIVTQAMLKNFHTAGSTDIEYCTIKAKSDVDTLKIEHLSDKLGIHLDGMFYLIDETKVKIEKDHDIKVGDVVFCYDVANSDINVAYNSLENLLKASTVEDGAVIATIDGKLEFVEYINTIEYKKARKEFDVEIPRRVSKVLAKIVGTDGEVEIDIPSRALMRIPFNTCVHAGDILTYGDIDYCKYSEFASKMQIIESMRKDFVEIYRKLGVSLKPVHCELIIHHIVKNISDTEFKLVGISDQGLNRSYIQHLSLGWHQNAMQDIFDNLNEIGETNADKIALGKY